MKRRKQSNRDMLERHLAERERNLETIARLTARNEELAPIHSGRRKCRNRGSGQSTLYGACGI